MFKKIFTFMFIFIVSGYFSVFAVGEKDAYYNTLKTVNGYESAIKNAKNETEKAEIKRAYDAYKSSNDIDSLKEAYDNSAESQDDITSRGFTISVDDVSPGMGVSGTTTKENVNYLLGTIIQNLMIALGSLALLIMTVGAGYILLHHGEDELLSRGKNIFMSGIYALVIALSSYYLISIVRYLLYFGDN
ncbi:MAG: hypothetical protein Q8K30_00280 [Candidatus Gracilibacteria bacterium]|nr:hypothetical protein [Candidatus Gracilibacteria bacterium]